MHKKIPNTFTFISNFNKKEILNLDKKIAIIFRNYEQNYDKKKILQLKSFCKANGKLFFLANNIKLAINLNLDGVYIPAFNKNLNIRTFNKKKNFLILGSAHNIYELRNKEKQGVEVIFLSPLFKTKHYKNGLGISKFNVLSKMSNKKIIALGGITKKNINKLKITNAYGFSGISYFKN
tara:strand:+ start:2828 stop:3364 length:537 start_codon:yes stop_codon:yes gene_type:complete